MWFMVYFTPHSSSWLRLSCNHGFLANVFLAESLGVVVEASSVWNRKIMSLRGPKYSARGTKEDNAEDVVDVEDETCILRVVLDLAVIIV